MADKVYHVAFSKEQIEAAIGKGPIIQKVEDDSYPAVEGTFQGKKAVAFRTGESSDRNPRPGRNHCGDILAGDGKRRLAFAEGDPLRLQTFAEITFRIPVHSGLFKILSPNGFLFAAAGV